MLVVIVGPLTQLLVFLSEHQECQDVTLDLARVRETGEYTYALHCVCGAALERAVPGPDDRYCVILRCLMMIGDN